MKSVVLASLIASAAAFAPAQQSRASTSLNEFCNGYVGGESVEPMFIGETGSKNFDPANFCEVGLMLVGVMENNFFEETRSHLHLAPAALSVLPNGSRGSVRPS